MHDAGHRDLHDRPDRRPRHHRRDPRGGAPSYLRGDQPPRRRQVDADRGARPARAGDHRGRGRARQGRTPQHRLRLDGDGEGAWHLDHVGRAAVRVRRPRGQPGRHPGPLGLLGGHLPGAVRGRLRGDADRRGEGAGAADTQAVPGLQGARHPGDHGHQQVGPARARPARADGRDLPRDRAAADTADLAGRASPATSRACWSGAPGDYVAYTRTAGGADAGAGGTAGRRRRCRRAKGPTGTTAVEESDLLAADGADHDQETVPRRDHDAGAVRLRDPQLRRGRAAGDAGRARAAGDAVRRRRGAAAPRRRAVQRLRVQGAGGHGHQPPRPGRLRARHLRRLRARHGGDARAERAAVRDQVRAGDVRS